MKQIIARTAVLLTAAAAVLLAPTAARGARPIIQCVGQDPVGTQELCPPMLRADLSQAQANGGVRVYGWVWTQRRYYGLKLTVHITKNGETRLIDSQTCATGSDQCTYDHVLPCDRDCSETGFYWLDVNAFIYGTWIGSASDGSYIVCD